MYRSVHVQKTEKSMHRDSYIHVCVHVHRHVYEQNQGGFRKASGPWTGVLSLLTLTGREYVKPCREHHTLKVKLYKKGG